MTITKHLRLKYSSTLLSKVKVIKIANGCKAVDVRLVSTPARSVNGDIDMLQDGMTSDTFKIEFYVVLRMKVLHTLRQLVMWLHPTNILIANNASGMHRDKVFILQVIIQVLHRKVAFYTVVITGTVGNGAPLVRQPTNASYMTQNNTFVLLDT